MTRPDNPLRASEWEVRRILNRDASLFVQTHHYSKAPIRSSVYCFGLFRLAEPETLAGAAVWAVSLPRTAAQSFSPDWGGVLSLTRLAISPAVPTNGATFLVARSIRAIRKDGRFHTLASYADTWQGHTGQIYKAGNWQYLGTTQPTAVWVSPEGRVMSDRKSGSHKGRGFTKQEMLDRGCLLLGRFPKHKYRMVLR